MKRVIIALMAILLLTGMLTVSRAEGPVLPEDMLPCYQIALPKNRKFPVYLSPAPEAPQAGNGKATVSTNDWIQLFGCDGDRVMIQYGLSGGKMRIGWIDREAIAHCEIPDGFQWELYHTWRWSSAVVDQKTGMTDDPFGKGEAFTNLAAGTAVKLLWQTGGYAYIQAGEGLRGFVPAGVLTEKPVEYEDSPLMAGAVQALSDMGIAATLRGRNGDTLYFDLNNGGSARFFAFEKDREYRAYQDLDWHFQGADDEDAARYLDAALRALADVEAGQAAEEYLQPDYQKEKGIGQRNMEVTVSNGLYDLEGLGQQGLSILLDRLAKHDGDDELNSLRARLAARMLGKRDRTGIDPALGCVWYDSLRIGEQNDLPDADVTVYEQDPLLIAALEGCTEYYGMWNTGREPAFSREKAGRILVISPAQVERNGNRAILHGQVYGTEFFVYDDAFYAEGGHMGYCFKMTLKKNAAGQWEMAEMQDVYVEDEEYGKRDLKNILGVSDKLAEKMIRGDWPDGDPTACAWNAIRKYLAAIGLEQAAAWVGENELWE